MCIVSFYRQNNQVLLTHNRDEAIDRIASLEVEQHLWNGKTYFAPIDEQKKGTWIFYSEEYIACILNGGKTKPIQLKSEYKKSRGLILLSLLDYDNVEEFVTNESFDEIAPFTIFVYERKFKKSFLLFWDENNLEVNDLRHKNFIFRASSTLYSLEKMTELENIFPTFNTISPKEIFEIHNRIKMNDGDVATGKATTSITQIFENDSEIEMKYCPIF